MLLSSGVRCAPAGAGLLCGSTSVGRRSSGTAEAEGGNRTLQPTGTTHWEMQLFKMTEWLMYYIYVTFNYNLLWLIM